MFPAAKKVFSKAKAEELGVKFDRCKPAELGLAKANDNGGENE